MESFELKYNYGTVFSERNSIEDFLTSIGGLTTMLKIRRKIRNDFEKDGKTSPLRNFYILNGKYHIDQFGQIGKVITKLTDYFDVPLVISDDGLWKLVKIYNQKINAIPDDIPWEEQHKLSEEGRPYRLSISISMSGQLPRVNTICPYCGKGWDIDNVDDSVFRNSTFKYVPIKAKKYYDFTGLPIKMFWDFMENVKPVNYYHQIDGSAVRNDKYIDNSPHPDYKTIKVNPVGLINKNIDETYILRPNDEVGFWVSECYHTDCNKKNLNERNLDEFKLIFFKAGIDYIVVENVPNEYCGDPACSVCSDWFIFHTDYGKIKIGWRKRVMNIDWSDIGNVNGEELFKGSDVTYGKTYRHAWDEKSAVNDLKKLKIEFEK